MGGAATTTQGRATLDELVMMGKKIWRDVKSVTTTTPEEETALLERVQKEYKDFSTSFPIVVRFAVQLRKFDAKALRAYLEKHATARLNTKEAFLELQAEYPVLLWRRENPHPDKKVEAKFRAGIVSQLMEEDKQFTALQEEAKREIERRDREADQLRRNELYVLLMAEKTRRESEAPK